MPMTSVTLRPGVNLQKTRALNEAGVSVSNLIRYKDGLIQKYGGWTSPVSGLTFTSTIRDIWGWQGAAGNQYLAVGTTGSLSILSGGDLSDVTPQTRTSNFTPAFSVNASSNIVAVVDPGSSMTLFDTVFFNTQLSVGGAFLQGAYQVNSVGGSSQYTVVSTGNSSAAVTSSGILPIFQSVLDSGVVTVTLPSNNYPAVIGSFEPYIAGTAVGGLTIQGRYQTQSIIDSTDFTIVAQTQATANDTQTMNGGLAQVVYYITLGPPSGGSGYGIGGYGLGGYGMGSPVIGGTGTPITATDWTFDNWGEVLIACPKDGPIYTWAPDSGFATATVIPTAPFFNGGIFISMPQQILVAWRSCQITGVQDPLIVRWSDADDYSNWTISNQTSAGGFHIPTGSIIMGGLQAPNFGVIWTDVDVWTMTYIGGDVTFNFTRQGNGCGLIGPHAAGKISGNVYWCGFNNFFSMTDKGVSVLPCTVWDFVFQNLDKNNQAKIRCAPNSAFGEISWYFPSVNGNGENDSYVKYNIGEGEWDYGQMARNAWIDVSILGNPISADTVNLYQQEETNDANGQPMLSSFESGYWSISEGNEMAFVNWFIPDMKFGTYSGSQNASVLITFNAVDFLGDTPRTYGPYTFTSTTEFLTPRLRGRFMSITVESQDVGTFWRIGRCRYRFATSGRR